MKFNIVHDDGAPSSATVFHLGKPFVASREHPNFQRILEALDADVIDESKVIGLFDASVPISKKFEALSERVTINSGRIFFDLVEVHGAIADAIIAFHTQGVEDFRPLVAFMEKIETNPNPHSREHLFRWLQQRSFAICPDGDFIAYKGVYRTGTGSYRSSSAGEAMVNGEIFNGTIPNKPGTIIEMPRDKVTFDPKNGCSTGLHAGSWGYASTFTDGTVLRVKINPRDVVSVPTDSQDQKVRVCRYKALDIVTKPDTDALFVNERLLDLTATSTRPATHAKTAVAKKAPVEPASTGSKVTSGRKKPADYVAAAEAAAAAEAKKKPAAPEPAKKAAPVKKAAAKKPVTAKAVAAKKAAPVVKRPKFYEDFKKADFMLEPYRTLQWLVRDWELKADPRKGKEVLATALASAATRRRAKAAKNPRAIKRTKSV